MNFELVNSIQSECTFYQIYVLTENWHQHAPYLCSIYVLFIAKKLTRARVITYLYYNVGWSIMVDRWQTESKAEAQVCYLGVRHVSRGLQTTVSFRTVHVGFSLRDRSTSNPLVQNQNDKDVVLTAKCQCLSCQKLCESRWRPDHSDIHCHCYLAMCLQVILIKAVSQEWRWRKSDCAGYNKWSSSSRNEVMHWWMWRSNSLPITQRMDVGL